MQFKAKYSFWRLKEKQTRLGRPKMERIKLAVKEVYQ